MFFFNSLNWSGPGYVVKINVGSRLVAYSVQHVWLWFSVSVLQIIRTILAPRNEFLRRKHPHLEHWLLELTGRALFPILFWSQNPIYNIRLLSMVSQLEPLQECLFSQWTRSHKYFRSNGEQYNSLVEGPEVELVSSSSLENRFQNEKSSEINTWDADINMNLKRGNRRRSYLTIHGSMTRLHQVPREFPISQVIQAKASHLAPVHTQFSII